MERGRQLEEKKRKKERRGRYCWSDFLRDGSQLTYQLITVFFLFGKHIFPLQEDNLLSLEVMPSVFIVLVHNIVERQGKISNSWDIAGDPHKLLIFHLIVVVFLWLNASIIFHKQLNLNDFENLTAKK